MASTAAGGGADDRHSRAVAAAALAAVAPTWLAAGRGARGLWSVAVGALPTVPPHRRLMLLGSLLAALPEVRSFQLIRMRVGVSRVPSLLLAGDFFFPSFLRGAAFVFSYSRRRRTAS